MVGDVVGSLDEPPAEGEPVVVLPPVPATGVVLPLVSTTGVVLPLVLSAGVVLPLVSATGGVLPLVPSAGVVLPLVLCCRKTCCSAGELSSATSPFCEPQVYA